MCEKCVSPEILDKINLCYDIGSEFPDGAWWALCEENGVCPEDLEARWEKHEKISEPRGS